MIVTVSQLHLPMHVIPIIAQGVSFTLVHGEVYSIQLYVIKFVTELWQVGGFLMIVYFPPPVKGTTTIKLKYC